MNKLALLPILFLINSFGILAFANVKTNDYTAYFDFDQSRLNPKEKERLESFFFLGNTKNDKEKFFKIEENAENSKWFSNNYTKKIRCLTLIGHTDSKGSDDYNIQLSKARVSTVKKLLIDLGYDAAIIDIKYVGESKPIADNESDNGRAKNRRVDIKIEYDEPEGIPVEQERELGAINDLYKQLSTPAQEFKIKGDQDTILTLEQGTLVMVSAKAFGERNFTLKITEIYKKSDMVLANLGTTSNGKILESGGMLNFEAFDKQGRPLQMQVGVEITAFMPNNGEPRTDMNFFEGQHDPTINSISWAERHGAMRRMNPSRFYWPILIGCGSTCDFWCRTFGKKDFAGPRNVAPKRSEIKKYNQEVLECLQTDGRKVWDPINSSYASWTEMKEKYNVSTWEQLRDTMVTIQNQSMEERMAKGTASTADMGYYVASVSQMGWINCDAFSNYAQDRIITMQTPVESDNETDGQLIFTRQNSIMKANRAGRKLSFSAIASGIVAWFVSIRFRDGKIFLAMKEVKTSEDLGDVEFKEVTVQELKAKLLKLDA